MHRSLALMILQDIASAVHSALRSLRLIMSPQVCVHANDVIVILTLCDPAAFAHPGGITEQHFRDLKSEYLIPRHAIEHEY